MDSLQIYNSLTRSKEVFTPIEPGKVRMYVCGMTIYDYCHIGHARMMMSFDVVYRWLKATGYEVTYVRNITDIDDKIINRAAENGEPISSLTSRFTQYMHEDTCALGILPPDHEPRATEYVPEMLELIGKLEKNGLAYQSTDGDVNYSVRDFEGYGKLSGKSLDDLRAGERVDINTGKRDPLDFVLWKSAKPTEPEEAKWPSRWGTGRPGWHIECSAMSKKHLGETIDIHAGGQDLQFPHHENEIAQSECCNGSPFAHYWMHNGYITIDNEKMSKSKGNFFTVRDILKEYDGEVIRFFLLSGHYRSPINFSDALMDQAKNGLARMENCKENLVYLTTAGTDGTMTDSEKEQLAGYDKYRQDFIRVMDDDLNTADAISAVFELITAINTAVKDGATKEFAQKSLKTLMEFADVLGLLQGKADEGVDPEIQKLVDERQEARKAKNFARADEIRDLLKEKGITLKDTPQGVQIIKE